MASTGVNVLRWGALVAGVFYGLSHQSAITARDKMTAAQHDYDHQAHLIQQAKAEFARKTAPQDQRGGVITDLSDPKFDLEAVLTKAAA